MPYNKFDESPNALIWTPGTFPSWWAPRPIAPSISKTKTTSTWYFGCGCIQVSTIIHSVTFLHPYTNTGLVSWGRAGSKFDHGPSPDIVLATSEDTCSVCKLCDLLEIPEPQDFNAEWKSLTSAGKSDIKADCKRKLASQELERDPVIKRFLAIGSAWTAHTERLLKKYPEGFLPNYIVEEDGVVYKCTVEKQEDGGILILTRSLHEKGQRLALQCFHPPQPQIRANVHCNIPPKETSDLEVKIPRAIHEKSKCVVCISFPEWCTFNVESSNSTYV